MNKMGTKKTTKKKTSKKKEEIPVTPLVEKKTKTKLPANTMVIGKKALEAYSSFFGKLKREHGTVIVLCGTSNMSKGASLAELFIKMGGKIPKISLQYNKRNFLEFQFIYE